MSLFFVATATLALIFGLGFIFLRSSRKDLAISAAGAIAISILDLWAISQSRSSTAAIGILIIPFLAGGTFATLWIARRESRAVSARRRAVSYVAYAAAICVALWVLKSGFDTRIRNAARDEQQKLLTKAHEEKHRFLRTHLSTAHGDRSQALEQFLIQHEGDDLWLAAAFEFDELSTERLEKTAALKKFELRIINHPNATPELIERLYRETANKPYLAAAIARAKNSPEALLRELEQGYLDRSLDNSFATNPSTPVDILERISKSATDHQMQQLLENPKSNCVIIRNLEQAAPQFEAYYQNWMKDRLPTIKSRACAASESPAEKTK